MPWTAKQKICWRELLEHLDDEMPADKPVKVCRRRLKQDDYGSAVLTADHFEVVVASRLAFPDAVFTLAEEWAHCLAGITGDWERDHNGAWGLAYAAVTKTVWRFLWED